MSLEPQLQAVDRNLQAISQIEGAWSLPALPFEAKLDLAGNTQMNPGALSSLLTGIDSDLTQVGAQQPFPTRDDFGIEEPVNPSYGYKPQYRTKAGLFLAGVTDVSTPQVYDSGAHRRLKQRLASEGYLNLSPEEVESDRWLPEYSYAAKEMNFDDMSREFAGNKPGSFSVESIMGFVDEWLSPRGLYRAAVELDLWWDTGNISDEFKNWDQDLKAWREDPLNPRKFIDLVTGPLDDLLFPALNIALLFTGISETIAVGRGVMAGVKGATALAGLHRGGRGVSFAARMAGRGADDIARFSQPGFIARKLPTDSVTAGVMESWRKTGAVILAKKANQQVMRAGFTSNVEQLIDSDRGGKSLDRFTGIGEGVYDAFSNPMLDWGVDILFTPTNIWNPGTFSQPLTKTRELVQKGFLKAANNDSLVLAWDAPVQEWLVENGGEEAVKRYKKLTGQVGVKRALSETFFEGNDEMMGAALSYTTVMAGLDHWARNIADAVSAGPLHQLDSGTRRAYHTVRNQGIARMKQLQPENVDDLITHFAKYGTDFENYAVKGTRSAKEFNRRYRQVQEAYLESAEMAAARGGAIPSGHTRFVGHRNPDTGAIEWRASREFAPEGDPFFLDLNSEELRNFYGEDLNQILSGERNLDDVFAHRYRRRTDEGFQHYRLSEADKVQLYDSEKLAKLSGLAQKHNELRSKFLVEMMDSLTPEAISQYVYEVIPSFGRMGDFSEASAAILKAQELGQLDNARFISPMSEANRRLSAMPWTENQETWMNEMFGMMLELPDDEKLYDKLLESVFAPFARDVDPQLGTFTAAARETATKQEALAFGATARRTTKMIKAIRKIKARPDGHEILNITRQYLDEVDVTNKAGLREVLAEAFGDTAIADNTLSDLAALGRSAQEAGVSLDDIERTLMNKLVDVNSDARWAERYNVPTQLDRIDDLVREVDSKIRELEKQAYYMASEVEGVPDWLAQELSGRGYKLVYGVEFAQPMDLDGLTGKIMPHVSDVSRRHIRQKSFGNFFSRQDPQYVSSVKARHVRSNLHARLANLDDAGEGARQMNLGRYPDVENADLNEVMGDLWEVLEEVQESARHKLDSIANAGPIQKFSTRASLARIPFSLDRLASDLTFKDFVARVAGKGYSQKQAIAMYHALQSSQALGPKLHGLYAIESKLRSSPNIIDGLRFFGTTAEGDTIRKGRAIVGGVLGGVAGNVAASELGAEEGSFAQIGAAAGGMLLGGALGAKSTGVGIPGVRALADRAEYAPKIARAAYLADAVANLRDVVRFSLSPIFDASRYSEAIILGQIGEMPPGLRNLKVNQSPSSFRKVLAREFRGEGMAADAATRAANERWVRYQDEFAAAARGYKDFDWEVIDGVGRRFSSVGILGFSPVDWMSSTYAHLRRADVAPAKAYEVVRDIYTYGTTGRSAAELSMNFVFFPFSFTKKTVGHFANFFSDDIGRLIVLQDSLAAYQMLDEEFDLSQEWKDRLPILEKAHRLNLLAYGIGLGQFGGVNAPFLEAVPGWDEAKAGVVNAFIPQMVPMATADDANQAWKTTRSLMPVINDVNTLVSMAIEQGRVIGSESHLTSRAEQRHAWDEWRAFQQETMEVLEQGGLSWDQAVRDPLIGEWIKQARTEISAKYPQWKWGMGDGIAHSQAIRMELEERIRFPEEPADGLLARYQNLMDQTEEVWEMTFSGSPEEIPGELFGLFRNIAIDYAKEDPGFLKLYNRFYRRTLGDITSDVSA